MGISFDTPDFTNLLDSITKEKETKERHPNVEKLQEELEMVEDDFEKLKILYLILEIEPTNMIALSTQAMVYIRLDKYEKAIEVYRQMLSLQKKNHNNSSISYEILKNINHCIAGVKHLEKKYDESIDICNELLEIDEQDYSALITKSESLLKLQKYSESLIFLKKALIIKPNDINCLKLAVELYLKWGIEEDALRYCNKILKIQNDDIDAQTIRFLASKVDLENSDLLSKINEKLKNNPEFLIHKCLVLYHMEKSKEFSKCFRQIAEHKQDLLDMDFIEWYLNKQVNFSKETIHSNFKN